jgi:hypothetical protein
MVDDAEVVDRRDHLNVVVIRPDHVPDESPQQ